MKSDGGSGFCHVDQMGSVAYSRLGRFDLVLGLTSVDRGYHCCCAVLLLENPVHFVACQAILTSICCDTSRVTAPDDLESHYDNRPAPSCFAHMAQSVLVASILELP